MKYNRGEYLPGVLNGLTGLGVIIISFLVDSGLPIREETASPVGIFVVIAGMSLVVWAAIHIKEAITGDVKPVLDVVVKEGPYKFVRHPVYLGLTVALAGVPLALRSLPGLIAVCVFFLPSGVYRAQLEEKALAQVYGTEWEDYSRKTGFMLPRPDKK